MTLTPEQLDELERKAKQWAAGDYREMPMLPCAAALHLVAVYRAALAWSEAQDVLRTVSYPIGERDAALVDLAVAATALQSALRGKP